ncbi:MAG TPA: HD domain-containing phosphohydrolase [Longimicrobium sp.]|nr:HD domain-containing phosphohydrolase [Longimicrobium sp.]
MISGRILIVSDRREVVAELEPIIRAGDHLASVVPDGEEAMQMLDDGMVPDVVISDLGCERSFDGISYVQRFRQLNRTGAHLVVTEPGAPFTRGGTGGQQERFAVLPRPFRADDVRQTLESAVSRVEEDFRTLRAEVWRSMDRLRREVADARGEMVQALALTIAARDRYMQGHCERVAEGCRKVALALNLNEDDTRLLEQAARLHEIGKISVPVELLQKTDPLTPDELDRIRSHPRVGADIVRGVSSLRRLAPLIEFHMVDHCELAGDVSPITPEFLLVGILRVVDAWDAMNSDRSYRSAMPRAYWEPLLRAGAGTRFHPQAVAALMRVVPE